LASMYTQQEIGAFYCHWVANRYTFLSLPDTGCFNAYKHVRWQSERHPTLFNRNQN
jgi:hypothetical protein